MRFTANLDPDLRVSAEGKGFPRSQADDQRKKHSLVNLLSGQTGGEIPAAILWCCIGLLCGGILTAIYYYSGLVPTISLAALLIMTLLTFVGLSRLGEDTDFYFRNRNRYYRDFFENAVEGAFRTTPDGNYLSVNRALLKIFGYDSKAALIGRDGCSPEDIYVDPGRRQEFQSLIAHNGEVSNFISEMRKLDGSTIWISENARAVYDKYHRIVCYEGTVEDITSKIRAERMMQEALHKSEEANRIKSAFFATMSHELRTPLNAIIGFSEIIKQEMLGPMQPVSYRDYAGDIHKSGLHLLSIINDILDASRLEGGSMPLTLKPNRAEALIQDALNAIKNMAPHERNIIIANAPDLPAIMVDGARITQCITKLVTNALKFTPGCGAITIRAELGPDNGVKISVIDTGIGMEPSSIAEAMQPFYQVDGSLTRRFEGTGLGLPITKALVELHGGKLLIRSALGEGTVVTISLPPSCTLAS